MINVNYQRVEIGNVSYSLKFITKQIFHQETCSYTLSYFSAFCKLPVVILNKRVKMALDGSPEFLRGP